MMAQAEADSLAELEAAGLTELREALELYGDAREDALYKAFMMKKLCDRYFDGLTVVDYGKLEARVYEGFSGIFARYGLRYELCSGTTLTAYRI